MAFSVIIPTHDHADTLLYSVESVQRQTRQDFEIFIVGDGPPPRTREIVDELKAHDPRIHYFEFEKGLRHGESHRDTVVAKTSAEFVCYLGDDDLWFPDHLETMAGLLAHADLAHTMQIELGPDRSVAAALFDATVDPLALDRMHRSEAGFGLSTGGHTLAAYRRLPKGWHPAPPGINTDLHFWLLFLEQSWCRYESFKWPTVLHLSSVTRRGWSPAARVAELAAVAGQTHDPLARGRMIRDTLQPLLDGALRDGLVGDRRLMEEHVATLSLMRQVETLPRYSFGDELNFGSNGTAFRFLRYGFHASEDWGAWMALERAGLTIPIEERRDGLTLVVRATHLLAAPSRLSAFFAIHLNHQKVFEMIEDRGGPQEYNIAIPESVHRGMDLLVVEFLSQLVSPADIIGSADSRRLGAGIICLRLERR